MNPQRFLTTLLATSLLAASLSGCGDDDDPAPSIPNSNVAVEGTAAKGIVRNADLTLFELSATSADPAAGRTLATGSTGADGTYSLTNIDDYRGGPVLLRLTGRLLTATATTQVQCDVQRDGDDDCGAGVSFGEFFTVGPGFILESYLPSLNTNATNAFNLSGFTMLMRARVQAFITAGDTTAVAIGKALAQVNALAGGINVVTTEPVNLNQDIPAAATNAQVVYAALNSAILRMAVDPADEAGNNLNEGLNAWIADFADGSVSRAQVRALIAAARDQLTALGESDTGGILAALEAQVQGEGDFSPGTPANTQGIAAARAFIADVRTVVQSYDGAFDAGTSPFLQQIEAAGSATGLSTQALFASIQPVVECLSFRLDSTPEGEAPAGCNDGTVTTTDSNAATQTATYTITPDPQTNLTTVAVTGNAGDATLDLSFFFPTNGQDSTGAEQGAAIAGSIETTGTGGVILTIAQGENSTITILPVDPEAPVDDPATPGAENIDQVDFDLDATLAQKGVQNPLSFQGLIGATVVRCDRDDCAAGQTQDQQFFVENLVLDGTLSNENEDALQARVELAVREPRSFNPAGGGGTPYSATNFVDGTLTLTFTADMPEHPAATVTIALDSTGFDDQTQQPIGTITVSVSQADELVLRLESQSTDAAPGFRSVDIGNGGAVTISLANVALDPAQDVEVRGVLSVGGQRVGVIEQLGNGLVIVRFDDGTFETLFN